MIEDFPVLYDSEDHDRIMQHKWRLRDYRYVQTGVEGTGMHRFVLNVTDSSKEVHHKNGNGLDNRKENLEILSRTEHLLTRGPTARSKTNYKGVAWVRPQNGRRGFYLVTFQHNKTVYRVGSFQDLTEAAQAYDRAIVAVVGPHAPLNFPKETPTSNVDHRPQQTA